ncbi:MAG: arabinofuranosidase catalytic domain-containing protein [Microcystaceae cyanobacterium]
MVTFGLTKQAVAGVTYFLDTFGTNCTAAWSTRKLDSGITNSMRIRRTSDNAETDIGFTGDFDLDTSAIATHCSGTTCTVTTLYDQSGNSRNITNTTSADQPTIYQSGATEVTASGLSKAALLFDNASDFLFRNDRSGVGAGNAPITFAVVVDSTGTGNDGIITLGEDDTLPALGANFTLNLAASDLVSFHRRNSISRDYTSGNNRSCISIVVTHPSGGDVSSVEYWENGIDQTESGTGGQTGTWALPSTSNRTWIGVGHTLSSTNVWYQGHIAEVIIYNADVGNTTAANIGDDQEDYFVT